MFAQKFILSFGSKLGIQFIQIVASIIVARVAGPTVLGTVAFGLAFVSVFQVIADLGVGTAHIKLISEGEDLGTCIGTFTRIKLILTGLFFLVVLGVYSGQKFVLGVRFESPVHEYVIFITLIAAVVEELLYIPRTTFMAKTEQAKTDVPQIARELLYQIMRIIIVYLGYRAVALSLGNLAAVLVTVPLVLYLFKGYPRGAFDKSLAARYVRISLPLLLIGVSLTVVGSADKIVLQYFTSSEQVGYYTAGYKIGGLVMMISNTVGGLFFPYFSMAASRGDFQFIRDKIEKFERFSFLFIMPGVIFLSVYSDIIVKVVLGQQYISSVPVMRIINLAMFIGVLNMPYANVITGMGFFRMAAALNISVLAVFLIALIILPNPHLMSLGSVGVALAVLIYYIAVGISFRIYARKICPLLEEKIAVKFLILGVVNFAGSLLLYNYLSGIYGSYFRLAFVPLYFGLTYLAFILLGWMKRRDLETLKTIVNVKKLFLYIRDEIGKSGNAR